MIYWMIFGMFLVTYLPRMLPMVLTKDLKFPPIVERWLGFIPYAALGALIFPGVLMVDPNHFWIGLVAAGVAFLISWFFRNMIVVLISAILVVFLLQQLVVV
jgi:branched-subunit amino acid transport protein